MYPQVKGKFQKMTIFGFLADEKGFKLHQTPQYLGKKVFLVVSIHFQVNLKMTQNLKKIGEMVLVHQVNLVFTWANFSAKLNLVSLG